MKRFSIFFALGIVLFSPHSRIEHQRRRWIISMIMVFMLCIQASPLLAQHYRVNSRSAAQLPGAQGMGDALVALPVQQSAFFYNPAHGAHSSFHLTIVGVRTSLSNNIPDQIRFFKDDLTPAIDEGIENLSNEELSDLYKQTLDIGRAYSFLHADILAPSVGFHAGPVGLGLGIFGTSHVQYNFPDAGGGLPLVNVQAIADGMAVANAAVNLDQLGVSGLTVGLTAKYTSRFATLKSKPLDAISGDEAFYVLNADRFSMDLGFQYELPIFPYFPGNFHLGLALYDIAGSDFSFAHHSTLQGQDITANIENDIEVANELLNVKPSFRLGVAYSLPKIPIGILDETGVSMDYIGFNNPAIDQAFFAHLRIGVQARVKFFTLRTGLNQGYPTVGGGLSLGFVDIDYAFYGREEGRYPGQLPSWHHNAQIRFGI